MCLVFIRHKKLFTEMRLKFNQRILSAFYIDFSTGKRMANDVSNVFSMFPALVNPVAEKFICDCWEADSRWTAEMFRQLVVINRLLDWLRKSWHIPSGKRIFSNDQIFE